MADRKEAGDMAMKSQRALKGNLKMTEERKKRMNGMKIK